MMTPNREPPERPEIAERVVGPDATVSVVVPTYNRRGLLADVIEPLLEDQATLEVLVVVDGYDDGSFEFLQTWARDEPRLRPLWQDNSGEAAARAAGLAAARGEIVLFLDDDVVAEPGLVTRHGLAHQQASGGLLVLGYIPPAMPQPRRPGRAPTYVYEQDYERVCAAYERDSRQVLLNLWAGNLSLSRNDALAVGMAGLPILGYHADKQFGYRCEAAGMRGVFSRTLRARHHHERSVDQFRDEIRRQAQARQLLAAENSALDADAWLVWKPSGASGAAVRVLASSPIYERWSAVALAITKAAGHRRVWGVETAMLRAIRQVDLYHHANHL